MFNNICCFCKIALRMFLHFFYYFVFFVSAYSYSVLPQIDWLIKNCIGQCSATGWADDTSSDAIVERMDEV